MTTTGMQLCLTAQQRLAAAGIQDGYRDATLLFSHVLNSQPGVTVPRHHLSRHLALPVPEALALAFEAAISAREARQPVSQITGWRDFWNHRFRVTRDTLDPRPDTETLIECALSVPFRRVLDLGTGTGAILISVLAERPGTTGIGTDISDAALQVARGNAERIGVAAEFVRSDWFQDVTGMFDLILSNPPYIAQAEMPGLSPEVRDWEPRGALTDEADGLSAYRAIADGAAAHLATGGQVIVEIGPTQADDVCAIFRGSGFGTVSVHRDLDGRNRVIMAKTAQEAAKIG